MSHYADSCPSIGEGVPGQPRRIRCRCCSRSCRGGCSGRCCRGEGGGEGGEEGLRRALGTALGSLHALGEMYHAREARWAEEVRRLDLDRERVQLLLRQVLGVTGGGGGAGGEEYLGKVNGVSSSLPPL